MRRQEMAKAIMIQGTGSNVGKSLIVAGLCRLLRQEGYKVAPFKAQNMALNSAPAVGGEIGRAQALQAQAAGVEPTVFMNPVLLKPTSKNYAQLIVNGQPQGQVTARQYHQQKEEIKKVIKKAYQRLSQDYELIVIEGAGSPAEINLKRFDLANMWVAKHARAHVYLTGDIERGGVFAALWGTFSLLPPQEQQLVKGFIINKFRGDATLLKSGYTKLKKLTGCPVIGLIPYKPLFLDAEDSLALPANKDSGKIRIGIVKLPHISNFTDFHPLHLHPEVALFYLEKPEQLKGLHACLVPGTKNSIEDLRWLKQTGLAAAIKRFSAQGGLLLGICGGFQILGQEIADPEGAEVAKGAVEAGLGLLPVKTVLTLKKVVRNVRAQANGLAKLFGDAPIKAYEIHTGVSSSPNSAFYLADGRLDGAVSESGNIIGTYLHGLFDNTCLRKRFLTFLAQKEGLKVKISNVKHLEKRLDEWADVLKANLNLKHIIKGLNEKNGC